MIFLYSGIGIMIKWKKSVIFLKMTFLEIPLKKLGCPGGDLWGFSGVKMTPRSSFGQDYDSEDIAK